MHQFEKVTRTFGITLLALLVIALGYAAKHGQFDPPQQQGQFLAKSVKMEHAACMDLFDAALVAPARLIPVMEASPYPPFSPAARLDPDAPVRLTPLLV